MTDSLPTLAVFKFASCDGCQLTLLDAEDELLAVVGQIRIANFLEASREVIEGPYDLTLVEGSITTPHDAERILEVREQSRFLVSIGACATAGGIQALRNWRDVDEFTSIVYANPDYVDTLEQSTAIADHVPVDFELRGCPISKQQLLEVISAFLNRRKPVDPESQRVCRVQAAGNAVRDGQPEGFPVSDRSPMRVVERSALRTTGVATDASVRWSPPIPSRWLRGFKTWEWTMPASWPRFRGFNAWSDSFREASNRHEARLEIGGPDLMTDETIDPHHRCRLPGDGWKARARCECSWSTIRSKKSSSGSSSHRDSSRRSCAAGRSPTLLTSPPGSVGSARSRIR